MRTLIVVLAGVVTSGCITLAFNEEVSATLPFHPHQEVFLEASPVDAAALTPRPVHQPLAVRPLVAYYPRPLGLRIEGLNEGAGDRRWSELPEEARPAETRLSNVLAEALPSTQGPGLMLAGVVTELAFYRWDDGAGGLIATRLTLTDAEGRLVAEQVLRTVGRADDLSQLLVAHARRCLEDPKFEQALWPEGRTP